MEDATGRLESGTYDGNYVYEGDWKQCANVKENASDPMAIKGLFCMSTWPGLAVSAKQIIDAYGNNANTLYNT